MIIDFHTHTFPDRIAAAALDKLQQSCHCVAHTNGTMDGLASSTKSAGIDVSVVLPVATNPVKTSSMNDLSVRLAGMDSLLYFGCIHPDTPDADGELARIAQAGLKGVKIHPLYQGVDIDDPRYLRILDKAGELGLIVVMHAGDDIAYPGLVRCSPEMTARALRQVGPVKVICAHMGGWHNWEQVAEHLCSTSVMLDTALSLGEVTPLEEKYADAKELHLMNEEEFVCLVRAFGAERIVFGTDSPWSSQADSLAQIRALPLTEEEKQAILGGNAQRLLGL